ncbi:MAG: hypothetical protein HGA76_09850, partial [Candidatus Firestonebacteria bacterium]|nr:hypothetical protein [Candidatus Firestonebacteria bacterium]
LTHLAIPGYLIHNGDWLLGFFETCAQKLTLGINADFYQTLDEEQRVFDSFAGHLDANIPQISKSKSLKRKSEEFEAMLWDQKTRCRSLEVDLNNVKQELEKLRGSFSDEVTALQNHFAGSMQVKENLEKEFRRLPYKVLRKFLAFIDAKGKMPS